MAEHYVPFTWKTPNDPKDTRVCVVAEYGEARVHIDFNDDGGKGPEDLVRVLSAWPKVLEYVRREILIRRSADEVEQDLLDLLGEGEDSE